MHEVNFTVASYNAYANELAAYFATIGPRVADIERGIGLAGVGQAAKVVEIGCGDGRDASEIIPRCSSYEGFDPSVGLLELARSRLPDARFVEADALTYEYPDEIDVVFAFASLLHVSRSDFKRATSKAGNALKQDGILYLSLKERPEYTEEIQEDKFGIRKFFYYNVPEVVKLTAPDFEPVYEDHQLIGSTDWFTLALKCT